MGEWRSVVLGDILDFRNGKKTPEKSSRGRYPVFGANGLIGFAEASNADTASIVIGRVRAYCGSVMFPRNECWVTDNAIIAQPKNRATANFISHLLRTLNLNALSGGSSQPLINQKSFQDVEVSIPDLETQNSIGSVLGAIDDKILAGNRNISTAFELAEVEHDLICESARGPGDVLASYVDKMIGGDWGSDHLEEGALSPARCIRGADIPSLRKGGAGGMPTRYLKQRSLDKRQLSPGDLVIEGFGGSPTQCTGRSIQISQYLLRRYNEPLVSSNFCKTVKLKDPQFSDFFYIAMSKAWSVGELWAYETGTTGIKNLDLKRFLDEKSVPRLDAQLIRQYNIRIGPMLDLINHSGVEIQSLDEMRGFLLPRLMDGTLTVRETEELVGGAV